MNKPLPETIGESLRKLYRIALESSTDPEVDKLFQNVWYDLCPTDNYKTWMAKLTAVKHCWIKEGRRQQEKVMKGLSDAEKFHLLKKLLNG